MDDYDGKRDNFHMTDALLLKIALTRAADKKKKDNAKILKKEFDRALIHKKQSEAEDELLKLVKGSRGWGLKKTHKKHKNYRNHKNYRKRTKYKRRTKYKKHKNYKEHTKYKKHKNI